MPLRELENNTAGQSMETSKHLKTIKEEGILAEGGGRSIVERGPRPHWLKQDVDALLDGH